ncbi:MAG: four helix bundle protein [Chloroflexi bacterium]|nr:four helix bundle protein [Chloroflexota bacterium]MCI0580900.1 four helix bundle protein [Chloroflexota bacterium]MCI0649748.1 four helix bundle protein [Chloroflexota bacterium]MCI0725487.1 four helix bundle protein [Chloroflexota bacterium]
MQDFRQLQVWQKSHAIVLAIYQATQAFPPSEMYGLTNQLRRSSTSIPTNIAEGCGRGSDAGFVRFLHFAVGSANEVEYQLLLAHDIGYLNQAVYQQLNQQTAEIKRMLIGLLKTLKINSS